MGARASVILTKDKEESPVLCQHWGGSEFHEEVREWITGLYAEDHSQDGMKPENRLEPERVFVKLVTKFGEGGYVAKDRSGVDDSDYGCLYVELGETKPTFIQ
jgi:hypothetical protein